MVRVDQGRARVTLKIAARPRSSGDIVTIVDDTGAPVSRDVGLSAVRALKGRRSFWPVKTGLSKRSFYWVRGVGGAIVIRNQQRYARWVENYVRHPARRTVERVVSLASRALDRAVRRSTPRKSSPRQRELSAALARAATRAALSSAIGVAGSRVANRRVARSARRR